MNDFTKEELILLQDGLRHWRKRHDDTEWTKIVAKKIQSLIDNYCEHSFVINADRLQEFQALHGVLIPFSNNGICSDVLDNYVDEKIKEKHITCLTDDFDNGYFWAMKELQELLFRWRIK